MSDFLNDATILPASERVRIAYGSHWAEFSPTGGGRLTRLATDRMEWVVPLLETAWPAIDWPCAGSYPLTPYSNRIREGRFEFEGVAHQLRSLATRPDALHGCGLYLPWQVRAHQADGLELVLRVPAGVLGWAWPFECVHAYRLDAAGLTVTLSMSNLGDTPMPFGMGIHPYFTARRVALHAQRLWKSDDKFIPSGSTCTETRTLSQSAEGCDAYLSQWGGQATLHWDDGHALQIQAEEAFEHLVVYTAPGAPFLCVEPVTNVADAFNLSAAGESGTGMRVLAPGDTFSASMRLVFVIPPVKNAS